MFLVSLQTAYNVQVTVNQHVIKLFQFMLIL